MVRYRLYGTANGSHSELVRTKNRRFSVNPAVTFGGDGDTSLTLLGNYQYDPENASYGTVPLVGTLRRASFGRLPRNFYDGDTSFEKFNRKHGPITYIFDHRFSKDWKFSTRGRYDDIRTKYKSVYSTGTYSDPLTLERSAIATNEYARNLEFDSKFTDHIRTGFLQHSLMFCFDYQQSSASEMSWYGSTPSLNVLAPNHHMTIDTLPPSVRYMTHQHQIGVYGQDEIRIGNLILTGSIRNDWYRSEQREYIKGTSSKQKPEKITFRVSGLYHFNFGLAPYISNSTSFQPQVGIVSNDNGVTKRQTEPSQGNNSKTVLNIRSRIRIFC